MLFNEEQATVTVQVQRNSNCPQFEAEPYSADIEETLGVGAQVLRLQAVDRDSQVGSWLQLLRLHR